MREMEFKMERENLVTEGETVDIIEFKGGGGYAYLINPALAMTGLYKESERLKSRTGIVKEIKEDPKGFYVTVAFDEENSHCSN